MRDYDVGSSPFTDSMSLVNEEEASLLAESFMKFKGIRQVTKCSLELKCQFLRVYRVTGITPSNKVINGWVIGGGAPYLMYDSPEIQTPIEALALYALHFRPWLAAKGVGTEESPQPDYSLPPDWRLVDYWLNIEESKLGGVVNFISFKLLGHFQDEIRHPDIRVRCQRSGWINP